MEDIESSQVRPREWFPSKASDLFALFSLFALFALACLAWQSDDQWATLIYYSLSINHHTRHP